VSTYGQIKSEEEWRDYVDLRFGVLRSASFIGLGQREDIRNLRTLCHAGAHGQINVQQQQVFRGILRQAVPRLREIVACGVSLPGIVFTIVEAETGKKIQPDGAGNSHRAGQ